MIAAILPGEGRNNKGLETGGGDTKAICVDASLFTHK
jgi:hypothetical protein